MTGPVLYAYLIKGDGFASPLSGSLVSDTLKSEQLAWVHLDAAHPEAREWLEREVEYLDHIIIDALLAPETRPRVEEFQKGALVILRGVNLNENAKPEDMVSIRLWVDEHRIISLRLRKLKAVADIIDAFQKGQGPENTGEFITMLPARLFERMKPVFQDLEDQLDQIEQKIIDNPDKSERQSLIDLRRQALIFRRYIAPQRDAMVHLRSANLQWITGQNKRLLQENINNVTRYVEDLDTVRERAQIIKEELLSALSDKMNKNMYMLTIVAAIFLPLGFLTGLLGINVDGIPGSDYPEAFFIFCGILVATVVMQIGFFKWLKWF